MPLAPDDIDALYRRHARDLLAFLTRRTWEPEVALDLVAETFAIAIERSHQYRGSTADEAAAWLFAIARRELSAWYRRGAVEQRAIRRLGIERRAMTSYEIERVVEIAALHDTRGTVDQLLTELSGPTHDALRLRIVEERPYPEVAAALGVSEQAARARVSRALRALAQRLNEEALIHEPN